MRRLNLSTALTVDGAATTGNFAWVGLTNPVVTEVGDTAGITVNADGSYTLAAGLGSGQVPVTVHVEDAAGFWIEGLVTLTGDGAFTASMGLGMNLTSFNTYNGCFQFANLMHSAGRPQRMNGFVVPWTYDKGVITTAGTDWFRFGLLTPAAPGWVSGEYTIRNPNGCKVCFGTSGAPIAYGSTWTRATEFTITLNASGVTANGVYLWVEGPLNGAFEIIMPGHVASYDAGDVFSSVFISYLEALNPTVLRFMDWNLVSQSTEVDWTDRPDTTGISPRRVTTDGNTTPYEYMFALAERLDAHPWICMPAMATDDYMEQFAVLANSLLQTGKQLYIELSNEVWNAAHPWQLAYYWYTYINHTKHVATGSSATQTFTKVAHGLVNGDVVRTFVTRDSIAAGLEFNNSAGGHGVFWDGNQDYYVEKITDDTFKLKNAIPPAGSYITLKSQHTSIQYLKKSETAAIVPDVTYANRSLQMWDIIDAELGVENVFHIVGSQAGSGAVTQRRFAVAGLTARADAVALAPYFNGNFWAAQIQITSNLFTPSMFASVNGVAMYVGVYAAGSSPTMQDVIDGTGTGFVGKDRSTLAYTVAKFWRGTSAGLSSIPVVNGVTYTVFFVWVDTGGTFWMNSMGVTASATASSVFITDKPENQAMRMMSNIKYCRNMVVSHAAIAGVPVIYYEMGMDFNFPLKPPEVPAITDAFYETAAAGEAVTGALGILASSGVGTGCYFSDAGNGQSFALANGHYDVTDPRFLAASAYDGHVPRITEVLDIADVFTTDTETDPGSFPVVVHTFADPSLTYRIYGNNINGNYAVVGNELHLINDYNINWTNGLTTTIPIMASSGVDVDTFSVIHTCGPWWLPNAIVDINFKRDRAYVDGVEYANVAAAVTAGDLAVVSGYYTAPGLTLPAEYSLTVAGMTRSDALVDWDWRYVYLLDDGTANNTARTINAWYAGGFTCFHTGTGAAGVAQIPAMANPATSGFQSAANSGPNTALKLARRFKVNDQAVSYNGGAVAVDTACALPAFNRLIINNSSAFNIDSKFGTIDRIAIIPEALPDAELQALTNFVYNP